MPASRPRAAFEPIPTSFDVHRLVENTPNFEWVDMISFDMVLQQPPEKFDKLVLLHVIQGGKPLVIQGVNESLDAWSFTEHWLRKNHGDKVENARNITQKEHIPLTIRHYLTHMGILTEQFFDDPRNYRDKNRQRIYLKDIDCPPVWADKLKDVIPPRLFYLNESTGAIGGPGSVDEFSSTGLRKGKGIAPAGDLMSSLPPEMRAENLMCYIGHEGTYTPAHREMCASLGQNIMVEASGTVNHEGKAERPGSSIWFMTETKDRHMVQEYWLSVLGHDIEVENHFAQIAAWKKAPFRTYVVEQRPGDLILIPPLAPHQVWNRGTRTMKVAWNRTTVETLEMAFNEALENSRMVCRDEQYKNKAIVYFTLSKYSQLLRRVKVQIERNDAEAEVLMRARGVRQVTKDFVKLFKLFKAIMISEMFSRDRPNEKPEHLRFDSNVTCSYCRGNIFNRFLTCKTCMDVGTGVDEPYDICMDCYVMGRSCKCQSGYQWVEQWKWKDLNNRYEEWRRQIIEFEGGVTGNTPRTLEEERELYHKRTLAELCQKQLELRPWVDVKNPEPEKPLEEPSDEEIPFASNGRVKKRVHRKPNPGDYEVRCHVCLRFHPRFMVQICTGCERPWCYGTLWRAYDKMPREVMEDRLWVCPHCKKQCNTGACRKDPRQTPYEPKGTLLGHDTKKVADVRSVEVLVDFSKANLNWLGEKSKDRPDNNVRLERKREEAERAKRDAALKNSLDDDDHELPGHVPQISFEPDTVALIDPRLDGDAAVSWVNNEFDDSSLYPSGDVYPPASGVLTADTIDDGFQLGYVDPSQLTNQDDQSNDEKGPNDPSLFPDLLNPKTQKRSRFSETDGSRRKKRKGDGDGTNGAPKKIASKQYQQELEKKRLDKAKRDGHYIQTLAAMRGKKKLVILKIHSNGLRAKLMEIQALKRTNAPDSALPFSRLQKSTTLLKSDFTHGHDVETGDSSDALPKKIPNHVKARVEEDDEYRARYRPKRNAFEALPSASGRRTRTSRYEEIEVDSEGESPEVLPKKDRRRERRGRNDENAPEELPRAWKDSMANPRRKSGANGAVSHSATGQKAPRLQPKVSTGAMTLDGTVSDGDFILDSGIGSGVASTPRSVGNASSIALSARMLEMENRRAKLHAARWTEDDDEVANASVGADEPAVAAPVATKEKPKRGPGWQPNRGVARLGPASKVSKRAAVATVIALSSAESGSESEDEIPSGNAAPRRAR